MLGENAGPMRLNVLEGGSGSGDSPNNVKSARRW
jgi:hypothetical protein